MNSSPCLNILRLARLLGLCLIVAGCAGNRCTLSPTWHDQPPKKLAVVEITNESSKEDDFTFWLVGARWECHTIGARVAAALEKALMAAGFGVIERRRVRSVMSELSLQASDLMVSQKSAAFGQLTGADAIVVGDSGGYFRCWAIFPLLSGARCPQNARIINIRTGEVLASLNMSYNRDGIGPFGLLPDNHIERGVERAVAELVKEAGQQRR